MWIVVKNGGPWVPSNGKQFRFLMVLPLLSWGIQMKGSDRLWGGGRARGGGAGAWLLPFIKSCLESSEVSMNQRLGTVAMCTVQHKTPFCANQTLDVSWWGHLSPPTSVSPHPLLCRSPQTIYGRGCVLFSYLLTFNYLFYFSSCFPHSIELKSLVLV